MNACFLLHQTDPLTGLFDRSILKDFLSKFIQNNPAGERSCGMLLLDIDNFKSINDAFGHGRGDQVLIEISRRLQAHVRPSDIVIRYGGDEFIILLPDSEQPLIHKIAERLVEEIHQTPFEGAPTLHLTISMGGASYPADALTTEDLFERADQRHYAAKRHGRGRFVEDDPPKVEDFLFNEHLRLVERDQEFDQGQRFLEELSKKKKGVFLITGQAGVGKTRFLSEIGKLAHLLGYAVLYIRGQAGLRTRMYGAVMEGLQALFNFSPVEGLVSTLAETIRQSIHDKGQSGLLLAVDNLAELDYASLTLVQALLASSEIPVVGLACVTEPDSYLRTLHFDVPLTEAVSLKPLSEEGLKVWLRALLQWEMSGPFLTWFHQRTQGVPALVWQGLHGLIKQEGLRRIASGWMLHPDYQQLKLGITPPVPARLPVILTSFIGRVHELQQLKDLIETRRLVNIVGPGGIGKTRLAVQAAQELNPGFGGEVAFIPLAAVGHPAQILPAIAQALGFAAGGAGDILSQMGEMLGQRKVLLVLDNFEHLFEGIGVLVRILDTSPHVRVVVTSRERLHLPEEYLFELEGLPHPTEDTAPYANVEGYPSIQLFLQRARRANSEFVMDEAQKPHIARICQLVKGMPLGIELAAAWARTVSCQEIAEQIQQNLDFLADVSVYRQDQAGYRNVRAVFDYFWSLLSETERWIVCDLSIFRGTFTHEAAQRITGISRFFLSALVDRVYLSTNTEGRYLLHPLLRQYTQEKLAAEPAREQESLARFMAYYEAFLTQHTTGRASLPSKLALQEIEKEQPNFQVALEWSVRDAPEAALQLAAQLAEHFWRPHGYLSEGRFWLNRALESHLTASSSPARAQALYEAATLANGESDYENACAYLEESLAIWETLGNQREIARTLNKLSSITYNKGAHTEAYHLRQRALPLLQAVGDQSGLANAYAFFGVWATFKGNYLEAQKFLEEGYKTAQTIQDEYHLAYLAHHLFRAHFHAGAYPQATQWAEKSLEHYEILDNYVGMASVLKDLGTISQAEKRYAQAASYYARSLGLCLKMNHLKGLAWVCEGLAGVAAAEGQMEQAAGLLGAAEHWLNNPQERLSLNPSDKKNYCQLVETVRNALGSQKFETLYAQGERMSLNETLTLTRQIASAD